MMKLTGDESPYFSVDVVILGPKHDPNTQSYENPQDSEPHPDCHGTRRRLPHVADNWTVSLKCFSIHVLGQYPGQT